MRLLFILISFLYLLQFSFSYSLEVLEPKKFTIQNGSEIEIGDVGPGQTFAIAVSPKVSTGGRYGLGGAYDRMFITSLPPDWTFENSKFYTDPLQAFVTISKNASEGTYEVLVTLWDEAGEYGLGDNLTFKVKVNVKKDVLDMEVSPSSVLVGAGQPARYTITIFNKGAANDLFTISSSGVKNWEFKKNIYIPAFSSKTVVYEVVGQEEENYKLTIKATSSSSDLISIQKDVSLYIKTNLLSDYLAINNGVILFPLTQSSVYYLASIIGNILSVLFS